jgi:hypothetical protein
MQLMRPQHDKSRTARVLMPASLFHFVIAATCIAATASGAIDAAQLLPVRKLQEASGGLDPEVTRVSTFQELLEAWTAGAAHIELVNHMDSDGFPLIPANIKGKVFSHVLPPQKASTKTVMVCHCYCSAHRIASE